jgi:hypothetical protein
MHFRKFAGLAIGLLLAAGIPGTALATWHWIGPDAIAPMNAGFNTPIWAEHTNGTSWLYNRYCAWTNYDATHPGSYSGPIVWEYMHHWPIVPSTGLGNLSILCYNSSTWYNVGQAVQSGVDYSVEYKSSNLVKNTYEVAYP